MLASREKNTRNEISSEFEKGARDFRKSTLLFACRYVVGPFEPGKYAFRVRANSIARYGSYTEDHAFEVAEKGFSSSIAFNYIGIVLLLLLIFSGTITYLHRRHPEKLYHFWRNPCHFLRRLFSRRSAEDRERLIAADIEMDSANDWNGVEDMVDVELRGRGRGQEDH